jgi:tetratricopeptide (TPR) repeat protein
MRAFPLVALAITLACLAAPARAEDLSSLGAAVDEHPDDGKAYDAFALAAFKEKRWDDAIRRLKVGVARIPDYSEGYYKLAFAYRQKKEWPDAADYYRRYIALNPNKTDPYFGLGAALEGLGDKKGAVAAYEKYVALEKSPQKQRFVDQAKQQLAKLQGTAANTIDTKTPVPSTLVSPQPTIPSATVPAGASTQQLRQEGDELRKQGKLNEAARSYEQALTLDRGNLDLYNDLGNVYFALKQYGDAARAFSAATSRDPSYALGWYNLAHALRKGDKAREAADAYKQYIRLKPDDPDPYYGLGQTLKTLGDVQGAINAFQKYVSMEKRPDEQRWVEKARAELQALQAMPAGGGPSGKVEDRASEGGVDQAARDQLDRELKRDAVLPPSDDDLRLIDPFSSDRTRELRDPFHGELVDPFVSSTNASAKEGPQAARLREYGAALAAYRRALARQAEDVSARFERGVAGVLAENPQSAMRAWNAVPLEDAQVEAARRSVEQLRRALSARR